MTQNEVIIPYESMGVTLTSQHNPAVLERVGGRADVYSSQLIHLYQVDASPAVGLVGIASKNDALFLVDSILNGIHVVREDGRAYSHMIALSWQPLYINIYGDELFSSHRDGNKLYKLMLDTNYTVLSSDLIITSPLNAPNDIYVDSEKIAVTNMISRNLDVFRNDGTYGLEWTYEDMVYPRAMDKDSDGNYIVLDCDSYNIQLISPNGSFIRYILENIPSQTWGMARYKNTLFVTGINTITGTKLYKFVFT